MPLAVEDLTRASGHRQVEQAIARSIATMIREYRRTGKIGNSRPANLKEAVKQATAIAYSIARDRTGKK